MFKASGDAQKFESVYAEYYKAERVTRQRLYLETLERILSKIDKKVIVDKDLAKGALPVLQIGPQRAAVAAGSGEAK